MYLDVHRQKTKHSSISIAKLTAIQDKGQLKSPLSLNHLNDVNRTRNLIVSINVSFDHNSWMIVMAIHK